MCLIVFGALGEFGCRNSVIMIVVQINEIKLLENLMFGNNFWRSSYFILHTEIYQKYIPYDKGVLYSYTDKHCLPLLECFFQFKILSSLLEVKLVVE